MEVSSMFSSVFLSTMMALSQAQTPAPAQALPNPPNPAPPQPTPTVSVGLGGPVAVAQPAPAAQPPAKDGKDAPKDKNGKEKNGNGNGNGACKEEEAKEVYGPVCTFFRQYPASREWFPNLFGKPDKADPDAPEPEPAPHRGQAAPFMSPPFPGGGEFQGYPVPGMAIMQPQDAYPLTNALWAIQAGGIGDWLKENRIKAYGWINASTNWSSNQQTNAPDSYWIRANKLELDQFVFKIEREVDSVQTDHIDWGFRSCVLYGEDYRYTIAGGWGSDQLFKHNALYGWDPIEQFFDIYIPWIAEGVIIRTGRWVACPDIETQLAPDNTLISHSILFSYDTYTQTGMMASFKLSDMWNFQIGINAGNDMAPWYTGATPCGFVGIRWVSADNKDAVFACLNQIDSGKFRYFTLDSQQAGHDNFNYVVGTYQHAFSERCYTKFESYFMWERDAQVGGSISIGPAEPWGGGGGATAPIPGLSRAYGLLNYTSYALSKSDLLTVRNECWRDETGFRSGFKGTYTSDTIGLTHFFSANFEVRTEVGYYRNWTEGAFDNGAHKGAVIAGADVILRF
jgi:hypothetical protein